MSQLLFVLGITSAYGSDFVYPNSMPPTANSAMDALIGTVVPFVYEMETPIAVRFTTAVDAALFNCIAVYESMPLDVLTKKAPVVRADQATIDNEGNEFTKVLCGYYAVLIIANEILPDSVPTLQQTYDSFGLDSSLTDVDSSILACDESNDASSSVSNEVQSLSCLESAASAKNYEPEILASIVAKGVLEFLRNDGWNADGLNNGACTANCRSFADTTGYEPVRNDTNRWQPLQEDNGMNVCL